MKQAFCLLLLTMLPAMGTAHSATSTNEEASAGQAGFTAMDPFDQVKQMGRGVNIIGYDPLWKDFSKARFKERHFERIHDAGFQTVRVVLQAFGHMDSDNKLGPKWLQTLDWAVKNALANHMNVILDEHDFNRCATDAAGCRAKLLAFWGQIAPLYQDAPNAVIFEILNEPNRELTPPLWNDLLNDALAVIRKTNPTRNVIIGPASWNNIHYLDQLELPAADRHIIVTVHYYLPMRFTHQGARWVKATANLSGITWGTDEERHQMDEDFAGVQAWSKKADRPIFLGEFGAYDKADMDSRVRYLSYVTRTAESLGWAWAYWQFDSDFIIYDMAKDGWVEPILKALVP
jgi:endoglucanase